MILHPIISAIQQSDGSIVQMGAVDEGKLLLRSGNQIIGQPLLDIVHGRMDLVSATQIKYSFLQSNQIVLWDGDSWNLVAPSTEPSFLNTALDMNGDALAVDTIYDVFAAYNSTTQWDFAFAKWSNSGAGTSVRCGAWSGSSVAYKKGMRVTNGTHYYACIHAHTSASGTEPGVGASWTNEWVDCGTDPGADYRGLYQHEGRWVYGPASTGANVLDGRKYRWLGVIYTYNNSTVVNFKDTETYRYVSNFYNRRPRAISSYNSQETWTYNSSTVREYGGNGETSQVRAKFVLCATSTIMAVNYVRVSNSSGGCYPAVIIGFDSVTTESARIENEIPTSGKISQTVAWSSEGSVGFHYITQLEAVPTGGNSATYTGSQYSRIRGTIIN